MITDAPCGCSTAVRCRTEHAADGGINSQLRVARQLEVKNPPHGWLRLLEWVEGVLNTVPFAINLPPIQDAGHILRVIVSR